MMFYALKLAGKDVFSGKIIFILLLDILTVAALFFSVVIAMLAFRGSYGTFMELSPDIIRLGEEKERSADFLTKAGLSTEQLVEMKEGVSDMVRDMILSIIIGFVLISASLGAFNGLVWSRIKKSGFGARKFISFWLTTMGILILWIILAVASVVLFKTGVAVVLMGLSMFFCFGLIHMSYSLCDGGPLSGIKRAFGRFNFWWILLGLAIITGAHWIVQMFAAFAGFISPLVVLPLVVAAFFICLNWSRFFIFHMEVEG